MMLNESLSVNDQIILYILGGAADKNGTLKVGDEIMSVNSTDCTRMSRIESIDFSKSSRLA